ncbi:hypothetical protein [Breznakiella homolactica]|uniref:Uncharacterized protein n=1 Tax=Breznakiella homolactica TaxID=2798577 RepID=A0A7T7XQR5_9SPIR|nr:hypothetical protein [Breznakiella homolactica]QQO10756.1 hypothetical protein JFL75_07525 [Breznakiella homolactica]
MADEWILIHPNEITNPESQKYPGGPYDPPGSLGWQIPNLEDCNEVIDV